jgi:protein-disulfide isomerase
MTKQFWGVVALVIVVLGGIFILSSNKASAPSSSGSSNSNKPTEHIEGQGSTGVKLVEYGDYECPVCEAYYPTVKQVQSIYNQRIFFQFRNLPLTQLHPNAFAGARAAEAAALQNKFWQMHDLLYDNQNSWSQASSPQSFFVSYAKQLGLNVNRFKQDYASAQVNNSVNADLGQFPKDYKAATGAYDPTKNEATPTFFLDGKYVSNDKLVDSNNAPSISQFEKVINAEIVKKSSASKQ